MASPIEGGAIRVQDEHWVGIHPLAQEHAVLLREVRTRGDAARSALASGRRPGRELGKLVDYLRYEVLDQAVATERLLFPLVGAGLADSRIAHLVDDHVRLREMVEKLTDAVSASEADLGRDDVEALLDALDKFIDEHMRNEEALLSTATAAGVESLRRPFRCHLWFPLTEGSEVDVDALPREFAHRATLERLSRLRAGERLLIRSSSPLDGLWNAATCGRPGEFGWVYLEEGPGRWSAEVTRRAPE